MQERRPLRSHCFVGASLFFVKGALALHEAAPCHMLKRQHNTLAAS